MSDEFTTGNGVPPEGAKVALPDGLFTLIDRTGREFSLDLVGTIEKLTVIQNEHQGKSHYDYLHAVIGHVKEVTGGDDGFTMNMTQADWLVDELERQWLAKKKQRKTALAELQQSLGSTG